MNFRKNHNLRYKALITKNSSQKNQLEDLHACLLLVFEQELLDFSPEKLITIILLNTT